MKTVDSAHESVPVSPCMLLGHASRVAVTFPGLLTKVRKAKHEQQMHWPQEHPSNRVQVDGLNFFAPPRLLHEVGAFCALQTCTLTTHRSIPCVIYACKIRGSGMKERNMDLSSGSSGFEVVSSQRGPGAIGMEVSVLENLFCMFFPRCLLGGF